MNDRCEGISKLKPGEHLSERIKRWMVSKIKREVKVAATHDANTQSGWITGTLGADYCPTKIPTSQLLVFGRGDHSDVGQPLIT